MNFKYKLNKVCSSIVEFDMDENFVVSNVSFMNGCPGNTVGVAKLSSGRKADELIELLKGTICDVRPTSCPDQFAIALEQAKSHITSNKMAEIR